MLKNKARLRSFWRAEFLEASLSDLLDKLASEAYLENLSPTRFAERSGFYLAVLNAIHPFRDGNSRTQRESFVRAGCVRVTKSGGHPSRALRWSQPQSLQRRLGSLLPWLW